MSDEPLIIGIDEARGSDFGAIVVCARLNGEFLQWVKHWDADFSKALDDAREAFEKISGTQPSMFYMSEDAATKLLSREVVEAAKTMEQLQPYYKAHNDDGRTRSKKHKQRRYKHA